MSNPNRPRKAKGSDDKAFSHSENISFFYDESDTGGNKYGIQLRKEKLEKTVCNKTYEQKERISVQRNDTVQESIQHDKSHREQNDQQDRFSKRRNRPRSALDTLTYLSKREPDVVVSALLDRDSLLKEWLKESPNRPDVMSLILSVLAKAFSCRSLSYKTAELFQLTKDSDFFNTLALHLVDLEIQGELERCQETGVSKTLNNILTVLLEVTSRNPSSMASFSRIHLTLGRLLEGIEKVNGFTDERIALRYKELSDRKVRYDRKHKEKNNDLYNSPPNDFREIDIFPGKVDIHCSIEPFLRKNKARGTYIDIDHYLDVQFRLLREDFVGPLRDGITQYKQSATLKQGRERRQHNLKIYRNVRIISPVCLPEGLCFKLQLDTTQFRRINWHASKRLIFGSLICLTTDDFETFSIATVAGREENEINDGIIDIHFEGSCTQMSAESLFFTRFTMAETTAYFEAYRHVLSGLQKFNENDLPFQRYLLQCETSVKPPAYLNEDTEYDFGPLIDDSLKVSEEKSALNRFGRRISTIEWRRKGLTSVNVLDTDTWPAPERLNLDKSQYRALRSALTKEFALIQGPPGTGKTFIGLKITKILLQNRRQTLPASESTNPMLIVCYTNHALDQFLEGISKFYGGKILRVGGRSKSDILQELTLQKMKKRLGLRRSCETLLEQMNEVARSINSINTKIDVYRSHVLRLEHLAPYVNSELYRKLRCGRRLRFGRNGEREIDVWKWLKIGQLLDRFEKGQRAFETRSDTSDFELPDIITMRSSRREYDEEADKFELQRLEEKAKTTQNLRKTVVAFYYEEQIPPEKMRQEEWEISKLRARNVQTNRIIKTNLCQEDVMKDDEELLVGNPWNIPIESKWRLYRLWVKRACEAEYGKISDLENKYKDIARQYKEKQLQQDGVAMRNADVIGMTTTCAARYLPLLQDIGPNIVIVEEAAEVLEAHIVTTLSEGCQHLILIGDHKQLRPSPSVYALATKFNLNVSLFERMILNGVQFDSLELQHRMRPEISMLMRHIYDNLNDHNDVKEVENIRGVSKNVFLLNHKHTEETDQDGTSYSNRFEAEYAASLCRYLLQQGYNPQNITVLATYASQLFLLKQIMPRDAFGDVVITVVDNYQGEENDIVILSLVRSNVHGTVGFLKTENRICVALSRAKKGFFIIGNFDLLSSNSELWRKIVVDMEKADQIGDGLPLYCQNHPDIDPLIAETPKDFGKAPEGGCKKMCMTRLNCGHSCKMFCHPVDMKHENYKCSEKCTERCEMGHPCKKRCHEICGKCPVIVQKRLTACGHTASMPCGLDEDRFHCKEPCTYTLSCGHSCQNDCGSVHTQNCTVKIRKVFLCGHTVDVKCDSADFANCKKKCPAILKCGHACSGTCSDCYSGRFHQPCKKACNRILVCGHECQYSCNLCLPCTRKCENRCFHSHCDKLCGEPCTPCMERCAWQCRHKKCTRPCSEPCNRGPCNKWCPKKLPCKHFCIGLCGEPCPWQCRICHKEEVTAILFGNEDHPKARFIILQDCGHIIESKALDKYMKTDDGNGDTLVQLKGCPICKTPIRKSYRYGKSINKTLSDIETVKKVMIGSDGENTRLLRSFETRSTVRTNRVSFMRESTNSKTAYQKILTKLKSHKILSEQLLVSVDNQFILLRAVEARTLKFSPREIKKSTH